MRGPVVRVGGGWEVGLATMLPVVIGSACLCAVSPSPARAFSNPAFYADPPEMGGGGGRWFTGSAADGYSCDVCHTGGTAPDVAISGLPLDGFMPGANYEVTIDWPATAEPALVAEFSDEQKLGAGAITLPRPETTKVQERCSLEEGGELPTNVFEAPGGRMLFTVIDCGALTTRFRWTAPLAGTGPVWFNLGFVSSDESAEPSGDGVTVVRQALRAAGGSLETRVVAQGCSIVAGSRASSAWWMLLLVGFGWLARLGNGRARRSCCTRSNSEEVS